MTIEEAEKLKKEAELQIHTIVKQLRIDTGTNVRFEIQTINAGYGDNYASFDSLSIKLEI